VNNQLYENIFDLKDKVGIVAGGLIPGAKERQ